MTGSWLDDKRKAMLPLDPRDPDHSRRGIFPANDGFFAYHNCSRCQSGARACVEGGPHRCSWSHARND